MLAKLCRICNINNAANRLMAMVAHSTYFFNNLVFITISMIIRKKEFDFTGHMRYYLYNIQPPKERYRTMSRKKLEPSKIDALKRSGTLNRRAEAVKDALFVEKDFFDPYDLLQVKYEMLRRSHLDGQSITEVCSRFGFSRLSFYRLQAAFGQCGLAGLLSRKRGPRQAHKLSEEVMDFAQKAKDEGLGTAALKKLLEEHFGIRVHQRSIERALVSRKKN